jgi:hypothetical protein
MATARLAAAAATMTKRHGAAPAMRAFRMDMLSASPLKFGTHISAIVSR